MTPRLLNFQNHTATARHGIAADAPAHLHNPGGIRFLGTMDYDQLVRRPPFTKGGCTRAVMWNANQSFNATGTPYIVYVGSNVNGAGLDALAPMMGPNVTFAFDQVPLRLERSPRDPIEDITTLLQSQGRPVLWEAWPRRSIATERLRCDGWVLMSYGLRQKLTRPDLFWGFGETLIHFPIRPLVIVLVSGKRAAFDPEWAFDESMYWLGQGCRVATPRRSYTHDQWARLVAESEVIIGGLPAEVGMGT